MTNHVKSTNIIFKETKITSKLLEATLVKKKFCAEHCKKNSEVFLFFNFAPSHELECYNSTHLVYKRHQLQLLPLGTDFKFTATI